MSLTSFPDRDWSLRWTLRSLLRQEAMPSRILLVLSRDQYPGGLRDMGRALRRLVERNSGILEVVWVTGDPGPYKKLLPALDRHPTSLIVTADDDVIYARKWLSSLLNGVAEHPGCIVGTDGHLMEWSQSGFAPYRSFAESPRDVPSPLLLLKGNGGIAYPPGSLDDRVHNLDDAMQLAPFTDDLWFKAMAILSGTSAVLVRGGELVRIGWRSPQLKSVNVAQGRNDANLRMLDEAFLLRTHLGS